MTTTHAATTPVATAEAHAETTPCLWCNGTGTHDFNDPWIASELGEKVGPRPCPACDGTGTWIAPADSDSSEGDWDDAHYEPDYEPDTYISEAEAEYEANRAADRYERWLDSLWP